MNYGLFINAVIKFVIVAFAVFMLVKQINRMKLDIGPAAALPPRQEVLLAEIRDLLKEQAERRNASACSSAGIVHGGVLALTGSAMASSMPRTPFHSSASPRLAPSLPIWSMPQ